MGECLGFGIVLDGAVRVVGVLVEYWSLADYLCRRVCV